jgi:hypothetical protein
MAQVPHRLLVAQETLQPHHLKAVMAHLPHPVKEIMVVMVLIAPLRLVEVEAEELLL